MIKKRFIYFHVPKCSGTTVYSTLGPLFSRRITSHDRSSANDDGKDADFISTHAPFEDVIVDEDKDWLTTSLRDPERRLRSLYRFWASHKMGFTLRTGGIEQYHLNKLAKSLSFLDFIRSDDVTLRQHIDNAMVRHFLKAIGTVTEHDLECACTNIARMSDILFTETLEADLKRVFRYLGREPIFAVHHRNVTDKLHGLDPAWMDTPPETDAEEARDDYFDIIEPLIKFDAQLYAFALSLMEKRKSDKDSAINGPVSFNGLQVAARNHSVAYKLVEIPDNRNFLWGAWSGLNDTSAWIVGHGCSIRFKILRRSLMALKAPTLFINVTAFLPEARHFATLDIGFLDDCIYTRVIFLNQSQIVSAESVADPQGQRRTIIVASDSHRIAIPLIRQTRLMENLNLAGADDEDFAYFAVCLTSLDGLPASECGGKDARRLGVRVNMIEIGDLDGAA